MPLVKSAKSAAPSNAVFLNPENFVSAGLMDDFDGEIIKARFCLWDYNGTIQAPVLGVAITIQPEEGDPFTQHYSAGDLDRFAPSRDGNEPISDEAKVGEDEAEGEFAVRTGKAESLSNSTNFAQFLTAALDAGMSKDRLSANVAEMLEGVYGHFNRIAQKKRSGVMSQKVDAKGNAVDAKRPSEILVITEVKEKPAGVKKVAKAAPVTAGKPVGGGPSGVKATGDDLDTALVGIVAEAVADAGDDGLSKKALANLAIRKLPGNHKAKGVKRIVETEFLESGGGDSALWVYDGESETLYNAQ